MRRVAVFDMSSTLLQTSRLPEAKLAGQYLQDINLQPNCCFSRLIVALAIQLLASSA